MAKDPAMLWYWSDWNSGTGLLSRFLKGCYMDLLHAQFNNGHLSLEEIKSCLGSDFGTSWPALQKKFKQSESGLFFNERLETEKSKRKNFCESRRKNKEKKTYDTTYDEHMMQHMENENRNSLLKDKKEVNEIIKTEILQVKQPETLWTKIVENLHNDYQWKEGFCRDTGDGRMSLKTLDDHLKTFIEMIEQTKDFKPMEDLQKHFYHWLNKKKKEKNHSYSPNTQSAPPLKRWDDVKL